MTGFRDLKNCHQHDLDLDGAVVSFGPDGVCWDPSPAQASALALRKARFEPVDSLVGKCPVAADIVTGDDFLNAVL